MKRFASFFNRAFRPFFLVTGAGTALVFLYALVPAWALEHLGKLPYVNDYVIITQHWGIMVGLMGAFMMVAAFVPAWRTPMALYSGLEKAFMVWLVLSNLGSPYASGFIVAAVVDASVVLFTIGYFAACGLQLPAREPANRDR